MFCVHTHSHIHIRSYVHVTYLLPHTGLYGEALQLVRRHEYIYMYVCVYDFMCMFYIWIFMYGWMDTQRKRNAE